MHAWAPRNVIHNNATSNMLSQPVDHVERGAFFMKAIDVDDVPMLRRGHRIQAMLKRPNLRTNAIAQTKPDPTFPGLGQGLRTTFPSVNTPTC